MPNELITVNESMAVECISPQQLVNQVIMIQQAIKDVMKENIHYGKIDGCGDKPCLLKPGSEKLSLMFRLAPHMDDRGGKVIETDLPNGHKNFIVHCSLVHIPTDAIWAVGLGSCSTMETKYRFRKSGQTCPKCGKDAIIKGKKEYGGGWICFTKKGGCGEKFLDNDPEINNQTMGRVEHDNPADYYNTCLKMAKKRAYVDATLSATAASDIFTQDIEDLRDNGALGHIPVKAVDVAEEPLPEEPFPFQGENVTIPPLPEKTLPTTTTKCDFVEELDIKEGITNSKPWTKYGIKISGEWYGTFSETDAAMASDLKKSGEAVLFTSEKKGKHNNLLSISKAS